MATIIPFLHTYKEAFDPGDIAAMSKALSEVCVALNINGNATARQTIAERILELARRGERSAAKLRDRVIAEASGGSHMVAH